jgi:hypothetical protein
VLLVRHFLQGTPQADLAAEAGVSAATMSRRVKHAIALLRESLSHKGVNVAPSVLLMLCARYSIHAPPPPVLLAELGKMAMVSGAAAKAHAMSFIPTWAASIPSPATVARAVAREWPRVSLCAAVGLGLYLAVPYVPFLRPRPQPPAPPQEAREVRPEPRSTQPTAQTVGTAALGMTGTATSNPAAE